MRSSANAPTIGVALISLLLPSATLAFVPHGYGCNGARAGFADLAPPLLQLFGGASSNEPSVGPSGEPTGDDAVPILTKWVQDPEDGTLTGLIANSKTYRTGTEIATSPVPLGARAGTVVKTESGSRYRLAHNEQQHGAQQEDRQVRTTTSSPPPDNQQSKMIIAGLTKDLLAITQATDGGGGVRNALSPQQRGVVQSIIRELETMSPTNAPATSPRIEGTWELLYADAEEAFRSSPFFLALRASCTTQDEVGRYDASCQILQRILSGGSMGKTRQIVTSTRLVSELELRGVDGLDSAIVSAASIQSTSSGREWELALESAEVKGTNDAVFRQLREMSKSMRGGNDGDSDVRGAVESRAIFKTSYLDDALRVSRDQDGRVFVFRKVSVGTEPTDYSSTIYARPTN